jgi:hypothetical protein
MVPGKMVSALISIPKACCKALPCMHFLGTVDAGQTGFLFGPVCGLGRCSVFYTSASFGSMACCKQASDSAASPVPVVGPIQHQLCSD